MVVGFVSRWISSPSNDGRLVEASGRLRRRPLVLLLLLGNAVSTTTLAFCPNPTTTTTKKDYYFTQQPQQQPRQGVVSTTITTTPRTTTGCLLFLGGVFSEDEEEDDNNNNDDDGGTENDEKEASNIMMTEEGPPPPSFSIKETLLQYLQETIRSTENVVRLPCGLDCEDRERALIQNGINALEQQQQDNNTNWIVTKQGQLSSEDVLGTWDLLYTSSRTMRINKSLSGLGRSTSEKATLQGIQMRLTGNKFLGQAEFVEVFGGGSTNDDDDDDSIALEVSVVGEWMLEKSRNIFTGAPSSSLRVLPETISYGVSKNKADEWASLGPIKLVDILYCDSDLMIVRGTANTESHFIYQRNKQPSS